ncbi:uncharacterized protein LOC128383426 [Scomber japonicus]|uniref:uncharacterized protein LOC128383426 n=1 Tax=Scomber japonicus TaxID=13676 RepID=UPI002305B2F3|nr:uncharacterized protein LOC128383426 [Scomber japonicus]
MMTSPVFVLYLICLFVGKTAQTTSVKSSSSVHPDSGFISANVGDNVTLQCYYEGDFEVSFVWYKQTLGQKPRLISTTNEYETKYTLHNEFKNNSRFTLETGNSKNHLTITDLQISDSATYYCTVGNSLMLELANLAIVNVNSSSLKIRAGTYDCDVASCGQILFGNGTKLDVCNEVDSLVLVYFLSGALVFTTILSVLLAFSMYKMKRNSFQNPESPATFSTSYVTNGEGHQDTDNLHYAALSVKLPNRSRRVKNNSNNECVYSSVK